MLNKPALTMDVRPSPTRQIAYIMSRFPMISETFILNEIIQLEQAGLSIHVFPLIRTSEQVLHSEAKSIVARAHFVRVLSIAVLLAQFYWFFRRPLAYVRTWWRALAGNLSSPGFFARALVVVPQAMFFAREMRNLGITHVHAHYATHPALAAFVIQQIADIPYSFTAHAHDIYVDRAMLKEKIAKASFIVAISEYNRRLLSDLYGSQALAKIHVIHCGIDLELFKPRAHRSPSDIFTIVCVASLQEYKGHRYLVDACAQLRDQGIPFRCWFIGSGEDRAKVEMQIAELGLESYIECLGAQPRERVGELIAQSDAMVLPSIVTASGKKEGIPVALMEALATELPVVATEISGIPELIKNNQTGLLVPERDATTLAEAIARLYNDPELGKRLGITGRIHVANEFDARKTIPQLYTLLSGMPN